MISDATGLIRTEVIDEVHDVRAKVPVVVGDHRQPRVVLEQHEAGEVDAVQRVQRGVDRVDGGPSEALDERPQPVPRAVLERHDERQRALDLGCGGGQLTAQLWRLSGGHIGRIVAMDCAAANAEALERLHELFHQVLASGALPKKCK